jgi:predicted nucleic acid binding AN1-type Zn finger protein
MKCSHCKKKTAIILTCACGKETCIEHRMPEKHDCTKKNELFKIEKLIKEKIIKI